MHPTIRYLTHPQVLIDPAKEVTRWSLNGIGRARIAALAARAPGCLSATRRVISSDETKAIETATPLARALGLGVEIRPAMHENDRSSTGFLPPAEFEETADAFFAAPEASVRGWETAADAQRRILAEVRAALQDHSEGDVLIVGHGAVGTLLFCALTGVAIDRRFDQGPGGGGCWYAFAPRALDQPVALQGWQPMESLSVG